MKYLAVLGYDCGCSIDADYGFMIPVKIDVGEGGLELELKKLQKRAATEEEGYTCHPTSPREIIIFNERFETVSQWRRD
jgi:hypothetical protein